MTDRFNFSCSPEVADLVRRIADTMVLLFDVPLAEADGRINRAWGGRGTLSDKAELALRHETAEFWAKTLYYGPATMWWLGEDGLEPTPYP